MPKSSSRTIVKATSVAVDLLTGAYPAFVYGGGCNHIPVFCFHGVEPELLEQQLRFLTENNYHTLKTSDLEAILYGYKPLKPRSVMLTFDDGWGSLWSVGLPLFKKYDIKVVVFLAAGRIFDGKAGHNLDDLHVGKCDESSVLQRDSSEIPLLTWDEIYKMHETGLVDFQSHSFSHSKVFVTNKIEDFVQPPSMKNYEVFEIPEWQPDENQHMQFGRPLYASSPRLGNSRRYIEDPEIRHVCQTYVIENGGLSFFHRPNWRWELEELVMYYRKTHGNYGRYETSEEHRQAILSELIKSKGLIEGRLPGKEVSHMCYPWHNYSRTSIELSHEAGYKTNFAGKVMHRYWGILMGNPILIARIGGDFFLRLPGKGRESLLKPLFNKILRHLRVPRSMPKEQIV